MKHLLLGVVVLASACSLPTPDGVKEVGQVGPGVVQPGGVRVFPPAPQPNQAPRDVVAGFLRAQASTDENHAIARDFLTEAESAQWDDGAEVQVYAPNRLQIVADEPVDGSAVVTVRTAITGEVSRDGRYVGTDRVVTERYALQQTSEGWRLSGVPDGLRLTVADLLRAYQPHDIYYVGLGRSTDGQLHLVPDRVFLQLSDDLATQLVRRALRPPSAALSGSVTAATPTGAALRLLSVKREDEGVLSVDLGGLLPSFTTAQLQALSARLVWTLRGDPAFAGLRLKADGDTVRVPGADAVQEAGSWDAFDPEGLGLEPAYFFVDAKRRLRSSGTLPASPFTTPSAADGVGVDEVAVTTNPAQVAVYDARRRQVHVGSLSGGQYPAVATASGISSLTWGSGGYGVWMLRAGRIVRVDPASPGLRAVTVLGQLPGPATALSLSRDGARAAVVASGRLFVLKIDVVDGSPRLLDPTEVQPGQLTGVVDVAWATPTELVVAASGGTVQRLPVDGSTSTTLQTGTLRPVSVAAAGEQVLVESGGALYRLDGGVLQVQRGGTLAVFPG